MVKIDKILKELKTKNKYYFFIHKNGKFSLIEQGKKLNETKKIFLNKIDNIKDDIRDKTKKIDIIFMYLIFKNDETGPFHAGKLGLVLQIKRLSKKGQLKPSNDERSSVTWFSNKFLEKKGFSSDYILKFLDHVYNKKIKLSVLGNHLYDELNI